MVAVSKRNEERLDEELERQAERRNERIQNEKMFSDLRKFASGRRSRGSVVSSSSYESSVRDRVRRSINEARSRRRFSEVQFMY